MGASCSSTTAVSTRPSKSAELRRSKEEGGMGKGMFFAPVDEHGNFERPEFYKDRLDGSKVRWRGTEDQTEPLKDEEILQVLEPVFGEDLLDRKDTIARCSEDLIVRCVRGYVNNRPEKDNKKWIEAMEDMTPHAAAVGEGIEKILRWRDENDVGNMLKKRLEDADNFYKLWPFTCGGTDNHGHLIFFERLSEIKHVEVLKKYTIDDILRYRAQAHELIQYWQIQEGRKRDLTLYKHIHVVDLGGVTNSDFLKIKPILQPVFKQTGDQYPNSLFKLFITNAPGSFRFIWSVVKLWLDKETILKINITGGNKLTLVEMAKAGIQPDALPRWLDGTRDPDSVQALINRVIDEGGETPRFQQAPLPDSVARRMNKLRRLDSLEDAAGNGEDGVPMSPRARRKLEKSKSISSVQDEESKKGSSLNARNAAVALFMVFALLLTTLALVDVFFVGNINEEIAMAQQVITEEHEVLFNEGDVEAIISASGIDVA